MPCRTKLPFFPAHGLKHMQRSGRIPITDARGCVWGQGWGKQRPERNVCFPGVAACVLHRNTSLYFFLIRQQSARESTTDLVQYSHLTTHLSSSKLSQESCLHGQSSHSCSFPKQFHQLGIKDLNIGASGAILIQTTTLTEPSSQAPTRSLSLLILVQQFQNSHVSKMLRIA